MNGIKIAYIGGGSKAWAKSLMSDLLIQKDISGDLTLYDIDMNAAERNKKYFNLLKQKDGVNSRWNCQVAENIESALKDADFIVISILPGTFDMMEIDVHLPEKYGIYQSVGDTTGPGGFNRALRTVPIYRELSKKVRDICPNAWVINYTNPMALSLAALYKEFPEIKAFGCCHEVFSTQQLLKEIYQITAGESEDIDRKDIKVNVQGINHFTWISEAKYKGKDLYPMYKDFAEKNWQQGYMIEKYQQDANTDKKHFTSIDKVKFDLFRKFGVIAAAGDRHLAEFSPSTYLDIYERPKEMGFHMTPVDWRKKDAIQKIELTIGQIEGKKELTLEPSDEEGVDQIRALLGYHTLVTNVNLPNIGQLPNLPLGAMVETNAVFSSDSLKPILAGKMNRNVTALVLGHVMNQLNFIEAYFEENKQKIFETFYTDPAVKRLSRDTAKKMFNELIDGTKEYLEEWVIKGEVI